MGWRGTIGLALCLVLASANLADAATTRKKAMWGPAVVDGRSQFPIYADLGVGLWQVSVRWSDVAVRRPERPTDPHAAAYVWPATLQASIADARRHGIDVVIAISGTPRWANGGRPSRRAPRRARDFADFVQAAARRYPAVRHWMIWGEPSNARNFAPLGERGPRIYAQLLDAAYGRLKRESPRNLVIGGNTVTVGDVTPRTWLKRLRLPSGRAPRMDLYGHNPFTVREPRLDQPPLGRGYADFGDLDTLAGWIDREIGKPHGRPIPIFVSELTFPTDHPNWEFNFYVTRTVQARWVSTALRVARAWPRLYTLGYLALYDDPLRDGGDQVERGLLERDGSRKPGYRAFKRG